MQSQILVVSDPPQDTVDVDAVAAILGLDAADARLKVDFQAPEVLFVSDPTPAVDFASSLRAAGMNVAVIDGRALAEVPWPAVARSIRFCDDGLHAVAGGRELVLPYEHRLLAVHARPPAGVTRPEGARDPMEAFGEPSLAVAEAIEWMPNLDLYATTGGKVTRISVVQDLVDFSGLGEAEGATPEESFAQVMTECARRFHRFDVDTRLENVRPRQRFIMGQPDFDYDMRKLYSFGTLLLRQALDAISPDLKQLTQYELGSRLAYVLDQRG